MALEAGARSAAPDVEREERRIVTVLFADLAGSTALAEQLDPEDVRSVQGELFALIEAEVHGHGGVCEKFVGDAVLAVFGIPQTHEDDAERAVRAALAISGAFDSFAGRVRERHGLETGLRIGVNTGEVVAGRDAAARGELMVSGDAVNVAARLQQRAEPGQVVVGGRTRRATARVVRYRALGAAEAKGKSAPVAAWEALEIVSDQPSRGLEGLSAPLIGRREELEALRALATRAERERTPQLVTLFGAAGVGKSRLLAELSDSLPQATVLRGRCLPYGEGVTYWPIAEIAKTQARIRDSDTASVAREKLHRHIAEVAPPEWVTPIWEVAAWTIGLSLPDESPTVPAGAVTQRLHDMWARYVAALGRRGLTLLAVEDVHWASTPMLDLLEHIAGTLDDTAVLLAYTSRSELLDRRPAWGSAAANATSLTLGSLSDAEAEELVAELLGHETIRAEDRARILERAEGNPFFVEEILQMLVDHGALARADGRWVATDAIDAVTLPDSVHGVIASRLDLLDAPSRDALRRCSVIGRVFWPPAVDVEDDAIAALAPRGLVAEQYTSTMEGLREFRFKHALTRDVAYATLPRPERRQLHRLVGEWVQQVAPDRGSETAEFAAFHLGEAIELGEDDPEVRRRAFDFLIVAGDGALACGAIAAARLHFERGLEMAVAPSERGVALFSLGRLQLLAGEQPGPAMEQLEEALAIAVELDDTLLLGRTLGWVSRGYWLLGRQQEARKAASDAVDALRGRLRSPELAWAFARRSQLEMLSSAVTAIDSAVEAIEAARAADEPAAEANARINLFTARGNEGVCPAPAEVREIVALALEAGVSEEAYRAVVNFLWTANAFMPVADLEREFDELSLPLQDVIPLEAFGSYLALSRAAILHQPSGRWDEVETIVAAHKSEKWTSGRIVWYDLTTGLAFRRGDIAAAAPLAEPLEELALGSGEAQRILPAACVLGGLAVVTQQADLLERVVNAVHGVGDTRWVSAFPAAPVLRAVHHAGDVEALASLVALVEEVGGRNPAGGNHVHVSLATGRGLLALHDGRAEDAAEALGAAVATERRNGRVYAAACIALDHADALAAAGRDGEAADAVTDARAVLDPLGVVNAY